MNFELLIDTISKTHSHFQQQATKAVNVSLTFRNWLIGYYIVEFEQKGEERAKYGKKLLANLAKSCSSIKGLDERTFRNFRLFYLYYPQIQPLIASQFQTFPIRRSATSELENNDIHDMQLRIMGSLTSEFTMNYKNGTVRRFIIIKTPKIKPCKNYHSNSVLRCIPGI